MKITAIEMTKRGRYSLFVEGSFCLAVAGEIVDTHKIKVGMEVSRESLFALAQTESLRATKERALLLLSYRDHAKKELYDKLIQKAPEEIVAKVLEKMERIGLINDAQYASKLAYSYLHHKGWSAKKTLFELRRKGIEQQLAAEAISQQDIEPLDQLASLLSQKYARLLGDPDDFKTQQKVVNAMARLGFSYGDIKAAISRYFEQLA